MVEKTRIDWCDSTWNPVTGCEHGCEYCYARRIANRFKGHADLDYFMKLEECHEIADEKVHVLDKPLARYDLEASAAPYPFGFEPTFHRYRLNDYIGKQGRNIFVCSMADLFGDWVPESWIEEIFKACEKVSQHNYLFLTKNPGRYIELAEKRLLPNRHWYGYSATRQSDLWTFHHTDDCVVKNLFVSIEPMLEQIKPGFSSHCPADWVIIGAETGNRKNKVTPRREWIEEIVMECEYYNIPLFMKSSLSEIWSEPLIQEFPNQLKAKM